MRRSTPSEAQRLTGETATLAPLKVPADWPKRIERAADRQGLSVAAWLRGLIERGLP